MSKDRNQQIFEAYVAGEKCQDIGKRHGLTKQRVIQIAKSMGAKGRVYEPSGSEKGWMTCKVEGCENQVRSKWGTLCDKHYFRGRRTGTTEARRRKGPCLSSHGYMVESWKGHPAASARGMLYEHRKVFYETFGPDGHKCKWCSKPLTWSPSDGARLHVDHLNGLKCDNRPENLVPSCHSCNYKRGVFMHWLAERKDDPVLMAMLEQWKSGD